MFCISCVNISDSDFNVLTRIDCMWCCPACRPIVEKSFEVEVKVEECQKYARELEARIISLETERLKSNDHEQHIKSLIVEEMKKTPTKNMPAPEMKKLISDEMKKQQEEQQATPNMKEIIQEQLQAEITERERRAPIPTTSGTSSTAQSAQDVITELHEQQKRKNNVIIYKLDELHTADEEGRVDYDINAVLELVNYLKDEDEEAFFEDHFENILRLGSYDQERSRPLLVEFVNGEEKKSIFNKLYKLKNAPDHLKQASVCHDMTRSQREADKVLVARAKRFEDQCSENYIFRVRGPPWKRFIKKIAVSPESRNQRRSHANNMTQQDNQGRSPNQRRVHFSGDVPRMNSRGAAAEAVE